MASTAPTSLASWRLESAVEPFFSGGAVAALPDGRALTACGDEVKVKQDELEQGRALPAKKASQWTRSKSHISTFSLVSNAHIISDRQRQYWSCRVHALRGELDWTRGEIEVKRPRKRKGEESLASEPPHAHCRRRRRSPPPLSLPPKQTSLLGLRTRHGDRRGPLRHARLRRVALPRPPRLEADDDDDDDDRGRRGGRGGGGRRRRLRLRL